MSDNIRINTTQNVHLNFRLASLGDRLAAGLIDFVILWGIALFIFLGIEFSSTTMEIVGTIAILYHPVFEILNNGRSIGKMALKTKVVRIDGSEPSVGDFILRGLLGIVELLGSQGTIATVAFLINGKGQRIGDMAAGTTVAKMTQSVALEETIFEETADDYKAGYPEAEVLSGAEVETIKEVLEIARKNFDTTTAILVNKTANNIEAKLGVKSTEMNPQHFLERVVKDYNYITGSL